MGLFHQFTSYRQRGGHVCSSGPLPFPGGPSAAAPTGPHPRGQSEAHPSRAGRAVGLGRRKPDRIMERDLTPAAKSSEFQLPVQEGEPAPGIPRSVPLRSGCRTNPAPPSSPFPARPIRRRGTPTPCLCPWNHHRSPACQSLGGCGWGSGMDRGGGCHLSCLPSPSHLALPGGDSKCLKAEAPSLGDSPRLGDRDPEL